MSSHVKLIRQALADALDPLVKRTGGGQATAYADLESPTPPVIQVLGIAGGNLDLTEGTFGRPASVYRIVLLGLAGRTSDRAAQERLDDWLDAYGDNSVQEAIEADQTLGATPGVWAVQVESCTGYGPVDYPGGTRLLGCEWTVRVQSR